MCMRVCLWGGGLGVCVCACLRACMNVQRVLNCVSYTKYIICSNMHLYIHTFTQTGAHATQHQNRAEVHQKTYLHIYVHTYIWHAPHSTRNRADVSSQQRYTQIVSSQQHYTPIDIKSTRIQHATGTRQRSGDISRVRSTAVHSLARRTRIIQLITTRKSVIRSRKHRTDTR
jgi:hypothetical protein